MWIKNLSLYQGPSPFDWSAAELEDKLAAHPCPPCSAQAESSEGFVAVLNQDDRRVVASEGFFYCMHQEISRLLPAAVIKEELEERVAQLQEAEDRRVGRKEKAELKEQVVFELLPRAFTRSRRTPVLIDAKEGRVLVDCASESRAEQVVSALRRALGSLPVKRLEMPSSPSVFANWLKTPASLPDDLTLGDRCELQDIKGEGGSVRFTAVDLQQEEVLSHLETMQPVRLNLAFRDQLEFDLLEGFALKRIKPLDVMAERLDSLEAEDALEQLQAELLLQGGMLRQLLALLGDTFRLDQAA